MMTSARRLVVLLCLFQVWPAVARARHDELVRLATLDWPPYNSAALPGGGLNTALVRQALANAGYRLEVVTMPWTRAMASGRLDPKFDGYFPVYLSPQVRQQCYLSMSAGDSPVVLAKRKNLLPAPRTLDELSHYVVGVVNGYDNTEAFDLRVRQGAQPVDRADSDSANLLKLASGRVDLIIIDRNVMQWLLPRSPKLQPYAASLVAQEPPIAHQGLYLCFKRTLHGQKLADGFDRGILQMNIPAFSRDYLSTLPLH